MKYYYDLHIHTALSPCGQEWMSPNNILNMANLKGLDFIAICDHNSVKQLINFDLLSTSYNMVIVPGIEVTVKEGYHVVCYFPSFMAAYEFGNVITANLEDISHDEILKGEQLIFDYNDEVSHKAINITLHQNSNLTAKDLRKWIDKFDGIMMLAHIERYDQKIYEEVQTIYQNMFDVIEINARSDAKKIIDEHPFLEKYLILRDSDAHSLEIINEPIYSLELEEKSISGLFNYIKKYKKRGNMHE